MAAPPPLDDDAFRIVVQIRRIVRALHLHSQQLSRTAGLTVPQLLLLQALHDSTDGFSTATRLCEVLGVNAPTMSGLVERMVKRGFITRSRAAHDRRVVQLQLTEPGRVALADAPSPLQDHFLERLRALPADERAGILTALDRVVGLMQAEDVDASPMLAPGERLDPG